MKRVLLIGLPILVLIGGLLGYFFYNREKASINEVVPTSCGPGKHPVFNYNANHNQIPPFCEADTATTVAGGSPAPSTSANCVDKPNCLVVNPPTCNGLQPPAGKTWCAADTPDSPVSQGCTQCAGGTACGACSAAPNQGYKCNCTGSLGGGYASCTGSIDTSCSGTAPTPTPLSACSLRYYFEKQQMICGTTTRNYSDTSGIDCDGQTGKSCQANLVDWLPGKTTGTCYKTITECAKANCARRYYFNTQTKNCVETTRYYNSSDVDCDGGTGKTCADNIKEWEPGRTTGICYISQSTCLTANQASASPTASTTPTSTPTPTPTPSSGISGGEASTPTPSPRAAMPDTSEGTPVTGIFEVTAGTLGIGLLFLLAGALGILLI